MVSMVIIKGLVMNWSVVGLSVAVIFLALSGRYEVSGFTGAGAFRIDRLTGTVTLCVADEDTKTTLKVICGDHK